MPAKPLNLSPSDVQAIVDVLDATLTDEHFRNPDRPDGKFVKRRQRQAPEVSRAKARIRTAHWRNRMDARRSPTAAQIGMAMVVALVTSDAAQLTDADRGLVGRMLTELQDRGFSISEALETLRRLRSRLLR